MIEKYELKIPQQEPDKVNLHLHSNNAHCFRFKAEKCMS